MPILNHKLPMKHVKGTDTSASTISANTMLNGFTSHDSNGNQITGTIMMYDGMVSGGLIIVSTEPTMYLYGHEAEKTVTYNGVELPDIDTVWTDKETYPYAFMFDARNEERAVYLGLCTASQYYNGYDGSVQATEDGTFVLFVYTEDQTIAGAFGIATGEWGQAEVSEQKKDECVITYATWTSHDILNTDGTVYLSASEPVPVYE